jgi:hypothetical protein
MPTPVVAYPSTAFTIVNISNSRPCCYHLTGVPEGTWYIRAVAVATGVGPKPPRVELVGGHVPVPVTADAVTSAAVRLRRAQPFDPPVLLALPDLEPSPALAVAGGGCPAASMPAFVGGTGRPY